MSYEPTNIIKKSAKDNQRNVVLNFQNEMHFHAFLQICWKGYFTTTPKYHPWDYESIDGKFIIEYKRIYYKSTDHHAWMIPVHKLLELESEILNNKYVYYINQFDDQFLCYKVVLDNWQTFKKQSFGLHDNYLIPIELFEDIAILIIDVRSELRRDQIAQNHPSAFDTSLVIH